MAQTVHLHFFFGVLSSSEGSLIPLLLVLTISLFPVTDLRFSSNFAETPSCADPSADSEQRLLGAKSSSLSLYLPSNRNTLLVASVQEVPSISHHMQHEPSAPPLRLIVF